MKSDDFVKCPLCHGLAEVRHSELLALLDAEDLRERLGNTLDQLTSVSEAVPSAPGPRPGEFAQNVHHWNSKLTLWRRSEKE